MNTSAKSNTKKSSSKSSEKSLKTQGPLSEKDEVKKAEELTNKPQKGKS